MRFSLSKTELISRIRKIVGSANGVPKASLNSSLNALSGHQRRIGKTLLEWQPQTEMLHILEPTFLFYLRQRVQEDQELGIKSPSFASYAQRGGCVSGASIPGIRTFSPPM